MILKTKVVDECNLRDGNRPMLLFELTVQKLYVIDIA